MIKIHQQSGFSLVETLVAISLLLIMIVGPMAISAKTAKSTSFASEQVQAFFLAQEGLD
jgi:prepilin-type N-terminal cleavage/methylation domain-containing protein